MADAANDALAELNDPRKYVRKDGVPLFRAHRRTLTDPKTGEVVERIVTEADLPEIVAHMKAMEAEGRLFRIGNGHIKPDGDEKDQPELLALFKNPRVGKFGPEQIPCVLVDEYARADKLDTLKDRPYRSAEYYPQSKLITGAAALVRDPQLNLGVVLYRAGERPWFYAEPVMQGGGMPPNPDAQKDDLSPEEVETFERMCRYMCKKYPQVFSAAMGPTNAAPPALPEKKDDMSQFNLKDSPEFYALQQQLEGEKAAREKADAELKRLRDESERAKCERLLDTLEKVERYQFDRGEELSLMAATDEAGRQKIAARIRKYHGKLPSDSDRVEVYQGDLPGPAAQQAAAHERAMSHLRANPGMSYEQAVAATAK